MSLVERFKKYLEEQFRSIKPTKEAMEYREEVLSTLLDHAQSYRDGGETNEDVIYDKCIATLGDFASTLQIFENKRTSLKNTALKASQILLISLAVMFLITVAYIAISVVPKAWAQTWLLEVGGAFFVIIANILIGMAVMIKHKKYILFRISCSIIVALFFILLYLALLVFLPQFVSRTWMVFFVMIIFIFLEDGILCYVTGRKNWGFCDLLVFIMTLTIFAYVGFALLGIITWKIYWILPVTGAAIDVTLIAIKYGIWSKKKKEELDEKYYTEWKD